MVEKAEHHGLEVDSAYLQPFEPCYNGDYHDSMSLAFRMLGSVDRAPGVVGGATDKLHQSVLDRLAMQPPLSPAIQPNLRSYVESGRGLPTEETRRVARTRPCAV